jgi:hypothetical protein
MNLTSLVENLKCDMQKQTSPVKLENVPLCKDRDSLLNPQPSTMDQDGPDGKLKIDENVEFVSDDVPDEGELVSDEDDVPDDEEFVNVEEEFVGDDVQDEEEADQHNSCQLF